MTQHTQHPESIIALLRKVKALADQGFQGEAVAARDKLDSLLKKHNLTISDLQNTPQPIQRSFTYPNERAIHLLMHIAGHICNRQFNEYRFNSRLHTVFIPLTQMEYFDVVESYNYYLPILLAQEKQQLKINRRALQQIARAVIYKYELFPPHSDDPPPPTLSNLEIASLLNIMNNITNPQYTKQRPALQERTA